MPPSTEKWQLERYRPLLRLQARRLELDLRLRRRFDSSDLVQETMLKAHEGLDKFKGATEAELIVWLQEILGNVISERSVEPGALRSGMWHWNGRLTMWWRILRLA